MEVRLWHEFGRYVSLIAAGTIESVPGAVATGSQLTHDAGSRSRDLVATGTDDLILKLRLIPLRFNELLDVACLRQ